MLVSAIICTYNRADFLTAAIKSLVNQDLNASDYEILVVDNNSSDDTKRLTLELIQQYTNRNIKYIFEPQQGLSYARNRGIVEAKGEYVAFLDDDAEASLTWLNKVIEGFNQDQQIAVVGGPVNLRCEVSKPEWCRGEISTLIFAETHYGTESRLLSAPQGPAGANVAYRRDILIREDLWFNTTLGRIGNCLLSGEESDFLRRIREKGYKVFYHGEADVLHFAPKERATVDYAKRRLYWEGRSRAIRWFCLQQQSITAMLTLSLKSVKRSFFLYLRYLFNPNNTNALCWSYYWFGLLRGIVTVFYSQLFCKKTTRPV